MKKVLLMLAAAMFAFAACQEDPAPLPPSPEPEPEPTPGETAELVVTVPVEIMLEGTGEAVASMPGDEILEYFGMTASEFYTAMGSYEGSSADGTSAQINNTIQFGLAEGNDKDNLVFNPSTCNNFGHWVNEDAGITYWNGQTEKGNFYACAESGIEWGLETPDEKTLAAMWDFTVISWAENGNFTVPAAGDKFSFTEVFYQVDENDEEKLAYVTWEITFTEFEAREIKTVETYTSEMTVEYNPDFTPHTVTGFDYSAAATKLGVSDIFTECDMYAVAADGTWGSLPSTDNWFGAEGTVVGYGAEAIFDFKYESGTDLLIYHMPFTESAAEKCGTFTGAVGFVNSNDEGVVLKLTITVTEPEAVEINVVETVEQELNITYNNTFTPYEVKEIDYAALATKLEVTNIFTDCKMYPVDPEGNFAAMASTDNWFGAEGTVVGYGANAIYDIKYEAPAADATDPFYGLKIFCMPYDENADPAQTAADKCGTYTGSVGFVAEDGDAVVLKLTLNIAE